ncbi:MAG: flagellar basal body-associated FliL family protein [Lachnospiraceae bacterium]|nr:flagellar basal body-associated FliL family protein [Lachnospiraceae bacterium]
MKKNLLSIVILSLLVVNIVMTAIMLFSVIGTNKKTAEIVTDIAGVLSLELGTESGGQTGMPSPEETEYYTIAEMTIPAKRSEGSEKDSYCLVSVTLAINKTHEKYATYGGEAMANYEDLIKSEVYGVIGQYTTDEIRLMQDDIRDEILRRVQARLGCDIVYEISFPSIMFG